MKVLQELGIKVVDGDIINGVNITSKSTEFYNELGEAYDFVSEFAWRDNDGDQPVGEDVAVEIKCKNKLTGAGLAGDWDWFKAGVSGDLLKWRPCLKSLTEVATVTPEPKLPVVIGGEYEFSCSDGIWGRCIIMDIGQVGYVLQDGFTKFKEKGEVKFRTIKSDRDIAIDEMRKVAPINATRDMMGNLYDAGYRK
tara:strand:- start:1855 stop:2439 length:585 start_codon:yes stop_codon:yes gene_type:complete